MCRTGDFNLSHASLTSGAALSALRTLPTTNPTLYQEITSGKTNEIMDDEPVFSDEFEVDNVGSDIPVDIIRSVIMSDGSIGIEGFGTDESSNIIRTGAAEEFQCNAEEDEENAIPPAVLGRGCRSKTAPRAAVLKVPIDQIDGVFRLDVTLLEDKI